MEKKVEVLGATLNSFPFFQSKRAALHSFPLFQSIYVSMALVILFLFSKHLHVWEMKSYELILQKFLGFNLICWQLGFNWGSNIQISHVTILGMGLGFASGRNKIRIRPETNSGLENKIRIQSK